MSHVHEGEWCAKCVEHGVAESVRYGYAEWKPSVEDLVAAIENAMAEPGYGYFDFDKYISARDLRWEAERIIEHWPEGT